MNISDRYAKLNTGQKEEFARVANKLFSIGFLTKKKEDNKKDYYFIENNKELFVDYFKMSGWELETDDTFGVIHLVNILNMNRYQFKLYESIILLIIRILYYEKLQELSLAENIIITSEEIHQKYSALKIRSKPIDKTALRTAIRLFKRFNIVEPLDSDITSGEARIIVYPTILLAIKVEDIRKVYEKLESYRKGAENEDEEVNEDEAD